MVLIFRKSFVLLLLFFLGYSFGFAEYELGSYTRNINWGLDYGDKTIYPENNYYGLRIYDKEHNLIANNDEPNHYFYGDYSLDIKDLNGNIFSIALGNGPSSNYRNSYRMLFFYNHTTNNIYYSTLNIGDVGYYCAFYTKIGFVNNKLIIGAGADGSSNGNCSGGMGTLYEVDINNITNNNFVSEYTGNLTSGDLKGFGYHRQNVKYVFQNRTNSILFRNNNFNIEPWICSEDYTGNCDNGTDGILDANLDIKDLKDFRNGTDAEYFETWLVDDGGTDKFLSFKIVDGNFENLGTFAILGVDFSNNTYKKIDYDDYLSLSNTGSIVFNTLTTFSSSGGTADFYYSYNLKQYVFTSENIYEEGSYSGGTGNTGGGTSGTGGTNTSDLDSIFDLDRDGDGEISIFEGTIAPYTIGGNIIEQIKTLIGKISSFIGEFFKFGDIQNNTGFSFNIFKINTASASVFTDGFETMENNSNNTAIGKLKNSIWYLLYFLIFALIIVLTFNKKKSKC